MSTELTIPLGHDLVPLSELELQTLRLYCDRDWKFLQHRCDPPASIIRLRERFLATRDLAPFKTERTESDFPDEATFVTQPWAEWTRLEVRWGAVVFAIVVGIAISATAVVASVIEL